MSTRQRNGFKLAREPFTFDMVIGFLSKVPFSPPFLVILPALTVLYHKQNHPNLVLPTTPVDALAFLTSLLASEYKWVGYTWIFILLRSINRGLNRYVRNHNEWRRDPIDYTNDLIVITGGSQGIGKQIVQVLSHTKKAHIAVLDMSRPTYAAAPAGASGILYYKTDVSNAEQVAQAHTKMREATGGRKIGALINCAGVASGDTILDVDLDSAARVWRINTFANWLTAKQFLPDMIERNHGHVVTVSSAAAFAALPSMSEYATSKAATLAFHECLAIELRTRYNAPRVRTTIVCPLKVRTALAYGLQTRSVPFFNPVLEPVQVARKVVEALDSGLSQHVVLPSIASSITSLRVAPDWLQRLVLALSNGDNAVTRQSVDDAIKHGYGKDWEGVDKQIWDRRAASINKKA